MGITLSHFVSSPEDIYFQGDEFDDYRDIKEVDLRQHVAFMSSMCDDCHDCLDENDRDYSFLRLAPCDSNDDSYIECETLNFSIMSNVNDDNVDVSGMDHLQHDNLVELPLWHKCHMIVEIIILFG